MFAVIKTGGKQYKVAKNDIVTVEKLAAEIGSSVTLDDVLLVGGDGAPTVGTPGVAKAQVTAEVVDQGKGRTITVFKKKRRKNYRRTNGHRQLNTVLKITDISLDGKQAADTDETKAKQASQKAGAKTQKQATQKATTEKSKSKSTTTAARASKSTQAKAATKSKSGESKTAEGKSAESGTAKAKSGSGKSAQSKSAKSGSAKSTASKSSGSKSASAKSGSSKSSTGKSGASKSGKSSGGSQAKKSEE